MDSIKVQMLVDLAQTIPWWYSTLALDPTAVKGMSKQFSWVHNLGERELFETNLVKVMRPSRNVPATAPI